MALSAEEFRREMSGQFWQELAAELNVWIEDLRSLLEDPEMDTQIKDVHQAQGSLRAVRNMLNLPTVLMEAKEEEEIQLAREKEKENEDG